MHTLVPAPPRRKPVNWYRVVSYVVLAVIVGSLILNVFYSWPVLTTGATISDGFTAYGGFFWRGLLAVLAMLTITALGIAAAVLGFIALIYLLMGIETVWKWWRLKIEEADKRNELTYED